MSFTSKKQNYVPISSGTHQWYYELHDRILTSLGLYCSFGVLVPLIRKNPLMYSTDKPWKLSHIWTAYVCHHWKCFLSGYLRVQHKMQNCTMRTRSTLQIPLKL